MIKVGVAGATGYVGIELMRILLNHPKVKVVYAATQSHIGVPLAQVYPHLQSLIDIECSALDAKEMAKQCDLIFTALPHGHSLKIAQPILDAGKKLIDLGGDFRLKNASSYEKWYNHPAASLELLEKSVYGLPEIGSRDKIKNAQFIANPGCYPTCIALGCMPAIAAGIIKTDEMILDAKSGTSGAGKELALGSHFMFDEEAALKVLSQNEVVIIGDLQSGNATATSWGCDLSYESVKINGAYRT